MTTEYNLKVIQALNGWVVMSGGPLGASPECFLVHEGDDLGAAIAATIMGQRLTNNNRDKTTALTVSDIDDLMYEKSKWDLERAKLRGELDYMRMESSQRYRGAVGNSNHTVARTMLANDPGHSHQLKTNLYGVDTSTMTDSTFNEMARYFGQHKKKDL